MQNGASSKTFVYFVQQPEAQTKTRIIKDKERSDYIFFTRLNFCKAKTWAGAQKLYSLPLINFWHENKRYYNSRQKKT